MPSAGPSLAVNNNNSGYTRPLREVHHTHYDLRGYLKDKGFMGHCEIRYNPESGKYEWGGRCYLGIVGSLARFLKFGFYKSWLDTLR